MEQINNNTDTNHECTAGENFQMVMSIRKTLTPPRINAAFCVLRWTAMWPAKEKASWVERRRRIAKKKGKKKKQTNKQQIKTNKSKKQKQTNK